MTMQKQTRAREIFVRARRIDTRIPSLQKVLISSLFLQCRKMRATLRVRVVARDIASRAHAR